MTFTSFVTSSKIFWERAETSSAFSRYCSAVKPCSSSAFSYSARLPSKRFVDQLLLGSVDVLLGHRDAELLGRLPELLELDEVRDVLGLDALVLGRPRLREVLVLRLVALLRLRDQLVELRLRDLRAVDDRDRARRNAVGAAAAGRGGKSDGREQDRQA